MADHDTQHDGLFARILTRMEDKLDNVLARLGKLESGHEQIEALQAAVLKNVDKTQDHEIRLTKIETKGGMVTAGVSVVVSLAVAIIAAMFKSYSGN